MLTGLPLLWLMRNVNYFLKWPTSHRRRIVQRFHQKQGRWKHKFSVKGTFAPVWLSNALWLHLIMLLGQWHHRSPNLAAGATTHQSHKACSQGFRGLGSCELDARVIHLLHPEALICGQPPPKPRAMAQIRCLSASGSCLLSEEVLIQPVGCCSEKQEVLEGRALVGNWLTNSCRAD